MGRGKKKKKPEQSDAKEPDKPPPVAPRPKGGKKKADTSFEQESSSKGGGKKRGPGAKKRGPGGKKVKKGDRQLSSRSERERKGKGWLEVRLCAPSRRPEPALSSAAPPFAISPSRSHRPDGRPSGDVDDGGAQVHGLPLLPGHAGLLVFDGRHLPDRSARGQHGGAADAGGHVRPRRRSLV